MRLEVDTVAGLHGDQEPASFVLGARRIGVIEIVDRWLSSDRGYYKLRADDGALYILRHDAAAGDWEMTLFQALPREGGAPAGH